MIWGLFRALGVVVATLLVCTVGCVAYVSKWHWRSVRHVYWQECACGGKSVKRWNGGNGRNGSKWGIVGKGGSDCLTFHHVNGCEVL